MMTQKKEISCPTCHKKNTWLPDNQFRPFCSERCKLIDLGSWADEKFKVPGETANPNETSKHDEDEE